jgi:CRP/FNR family cyclic AMP-dependent transcriptional regulator
MFGRSDGRIDELRSVPVFSGCTDRELQHVARVTESVGLPARSVLTREGRTGRECFVLVDGEVQVTIKGEEVARLGPGEIVGEMAIVSGEPRSATVVATTPVRALVMTPLAFASILDHCPTVVRRTMRTVVQRLRDVQSSAA